MSNHLKHSRRATCEFLEPRRLLATVKIMPLGDSITEGWPDNSRVSYRFWLWKKLQLAGYDVNFVGTRNGVAAGTPIYTDWDQNHQGTSGQFADQVASQVAGWASTSQPEIVLLHIGTNDILNGQSVASTVTDINTIIDNVRSSRPDADILLAKIVPSTSNNSQITQLNIQITTIAANKDTPQSRVVIVDQNTGFSATSDMFDGIHPNSRGERKMSNKWYPALAALLPAPAAPTPPAITYLSDLNWASMTNGFGPAELDQSTGPSGSDDGGAIWLAGVTYPKGIGTHANSEIVYNLGGQYARFLASIGIDDDSGSQGSSVFQVFIDNVKLYDSGMMTGNTATKNIDVPVAGANQLKLVVTDGGNNTDWDHGDWAMARLTTQPTVASAGFNFDSAPHQLKFTFRGNVSASLSADDISVTNLTTGAPIPAASIELAGYDSSTDTATFTFPGFPGGVLPNANFRATLVAAGITDAAGNPMPANHTFDFFFQMADADHDGVVNSDDFNILASNFGTSGNSFSDGDFNYDTLVTSDDFNILATRFGAALGPNAFSTRGVGHSRDARLAGPADDRVAESVLV